MANPTPTATPRHLIARDEGLLRLHRIDTGAREPVVWSVPVPPGRDMHLLDEARVLIGTDSGYEVRSTADGRLLSSEGGFPGTLTAQPRPGGGVLLTGIDMLGASGIVLAEVGPGGAVAGRIVYPGFNYARLVRATRRGTWLVTSNREIFEGDASGGILWRAAVDSAVADPHAWKAQELADGRILAACGYAASLQWFAPGGALLATRVAPADTRPHFYCDLRVRPDGCLLLTNWQGHGPGLGHEGAQIMLLSPDGGLLWRWKQDADRISSLQAALCLEDGPVP